MDGLRYHVGSISGFAITPDCHSRDMDGKWKTEWYVHDRFNACQVVASFKNTKGRNGEQRARDLARELNAEERRWEKEDPR